MLNFVISHYGKGIMVVLTIASLSTKKYIGMQMRKLYFIIWKIWNHLKFI